MNKWLIKNFNNIYIINYIEFNYYFGRRNCGNSPWINRNNTIPKIFPNEINLFNNYSEWFEENLNFLPNDTIAIIGAHTLGETHIDYSGYKGSWTSNKHHFDNEFYINLKNKIWI